MQFGALEHRVTIKRRVTGQGPIGQPVDSWVDVATVWAHIHNRSGAQAIRADKDTSIVQASIRIYRRDGLDASMRVHHRGTVYEIQAVLPDEARREFMDLVCRAVT